MLGCVSVAYCPDGEDANRSNGVIAPLDYGIFNVFRVSVSALSVGDCGEARRGFARVMIRRVCTDCRAYRVTARLAWQRCFHARSLSHATMSWLRLTNSQGLSGGRSGADSCMRRLGMPRYSVCASCVEWEGWA